MIFMSGVPVLEKWLTLTLSSLSRLMINPTYRDFKTDTIDRRIFIVSFYSKNFQNFKAAVC